MCATITNHFLGGTAWSQMAEFVPWRGRKEGADGSIKSKCIHSCNHIYEVLLCILKGHSHCIL